MYCPSCASQIPNDVKFCAHCGMNLTMVSELLSGRIVEAPRSDELTRLIAKCHSGYLSTMIGFGLVTISLLIAIAAMMIRSMPIAISGLMFLAWAIPAIAQGAGKWLSAKKEMRSILESRSDTMVEGPPQRSLPSRQAVSGAHRFAGSVTERTTANLDR